MPTYEFHYVRGIRTRKYAGIEKITIRAADINASSWLRKALAVSAHYSTKAPSSVTIRNVGVAIELLVRNPKALRFLNMPSDRLTERGIENLFDTLEGEIATEFQGRAAARISREFRYLILRSLALISVNVSIARVRFRTRFRWEGGSRKLISDLPSHEAAMQRRHPIGTMGGSTYEEMRTAHTKVLEADLEAIRSAANTELNYFKQLREQIRGLSALEIDPETVKFVKKAYIDQDTSVRQREHFKSLTRQRPLAALSVCAKIAWERRHVGAKGPHFFHFADAIKDGLPGHTEQYHLRTRHLLSLPFRACTMEVLSAFVLILTYTGWNSSSLCRMLIHGIVENEDGTTALQGYKAKTDDDTPTYVFDKKQTDLVYAVSLLRWNRAQLIELGFITAEQHQLWFAWTLRDGPICHPTISFQDFLKRFQQRHQLPRFSFDQIRIQVLALVYAKSGSHELTRHMAGHANLYSLGYYINQLLLLRLASASNLDFAKRLEASTYFDISPTRRQRRKNSTRQAVPVGDGSACSDPWNPPQDNLLDGEVCSGTACHVGDGCKNRRLVITLERMEELARKRLYFHRNWQRLLGENPEKFRLLTFPSFLFVERLCLLIESGPHRELLTEMAARIEREMED